MNPVEPLPQDWCESVIRILEKGSVSHIRWTIRAQMDWSPFGIPYQASSFLVRALRQPGLWGESIAGMMPLPGAPKGIKPPEYLPFSANTHSELLSLSMQKNIMALIAPIAVSERMTIFSLCSIFDPASTSHFKVFFGILKFPTFCCWRTALF